MAPSALADPRAPTAPDRWRDLRTFGVLAGAAAAAMPWLPEVGVTCPLRRVTGVPCPFCGMTTGTIEALNGDLAASVAANPAALVLMAAMVWAWLRLLPSPLRWRAPGVRTGAAPLPLPVRVAPWVAVGVLWIFQLARYDFV